MSERNFLRPYVGKEISGCGRLVFVNRVKNEKTGEIGTREGKKYVGLISISWREARSRRLRMPGLPSEMIPQRILITLTK